MDWFYPLIVAVAFLSGALVGFWSGVMAAHR